MTGALWRDARRALRGLRRSPGFGATAVLTLAVGIGACTAIFSVVQAVLLRPFGVGDPGRVVVLWPETQDTPGEFAFNDGQALRAALPALADVALVASVSGEATMTIPGEEPFTASDHLVSASFFDVLHARPLLGRGFRPDDDRPTAARVLVLSHALWQARFDGAPDVVGRRVSVREGKDAQIFEIVGVMPEAFFYPSGTDYWTPTAPVISRAASQYGMSQSEGFDKIGVFHAVARLAPGFDAAGIRAQAPAFLQARSRQLGADPSRLDLRVVPLMDDIFGPARLALLMLMGAVVVVLLVACANVAGLLLARGTARTRELAVRASLGASRGALVRGLLTEGAVLAVLGAALGVSLAVTLANALVALSPVGVPRLDNVGLDGTVLAFGILAAAVTTLAVGLVPAWQLSRLSFAGQLRGGSTGAVRDGGRVRTRSALVAFQVSVTLVLLMAAALCLRSFVHVARLELGFVPSNVLTFRIDNLDAARYPTRPERTEAVEQMLSRIERLPQVRSASAVLLPPFALGSIGNDSGLLLEGQPDSPETYSRNPMLNWEAVTPEYFRTMGIRLLRGRDFELADAAGAPLVVIVSDAMAARVWPGQDPIGKRLRAYGSAPQSGPPRWQTVVGVVATARYREIETPRLDLYVPLRQSPDVMQTFVVKTTIDPLAAAPTIGAEIRSFDRALRMNGVTTMDAIVRRVRGPWQFDMWVFGLFGIVALGLATMGLFGTVAYAATQRRRELGIRLALGATPRGISALMLRQGLAPTVIGLALGVPLGLSTTRLLTDLLFGISATDPATAVVVILLLLGAAALASYLPARRAAATDPSVVLRSE